MARREFSKQTKRQALERSQLRCEAVGPLYGLEEGIRCSIPLSHGVEFDHWIADALGGDNSLENCLSVCPRCHRAKTSRNDVPKAAKTKRVADKHKGITGPKAKIASRGFAPSSKPRRERTQLPYRPLFAKQEQGE